MGSIVTVATSKGGGGKTALTTLLAANLASRLRVSVTDADRNASFATWHGLGYEGPALTCLTEIRHIEVVDTLQAQAENHDLALCDTAGFENQTAAMAIATSDAVLIPLMADRGTAREAIKTCKQVIACGKSARRTIPYLIVPMAWNPRGLAERATLEEMAEAEGALGLQLPIARQHISTSAEVRKMSYTGRVPTSGTIGLEIDRLIAELTGAGILPAKSSFPSREPIQSDLLAASTEASS
jgi:chromosome partitioning protein